MKKTTAFILIIFLSAILHAQNGPTNEAASPEGAKTGPTNGSETEKITEPETEKPKPVEETKPAPAPTPAAQSEEQKLLTLANANTKNPDVYSRLLKIYQAQGRHKDRLSIALKAIQNIGGNAELYMIIGIENEFLGDFPKALISYQFALRILPTDHNTYNRIGLVLLKLANYHQAETAFRAAVHYSAGGNIYMRGIYFNNLGVAYEALHDLKAAYKNFQTALKLYPGYGKAQENFARVRNSLKSAGISVN